jgi:hypothetical protein
MLPLESRKDSECADNAFAGAGPAESTDTAEGSLSDTKKVSRCAIKNKARRVSKAIRRSMLKSLAETNADETSVSLDLEKSGENDQNSRETTPLKTPHSCCTQDVCLPTASADEGSPDPGRNPLSEADAQINHLLAVLESTLHSIETEERREEKARPPLLHHALPSTAMP